MSNRLKTLNNWRTVLAVAGLLLAIAVINSQPTFGRPSGPGNSPNTPDIATAQQAQKSADGVAGPIVSQAARFDVSPPLRSIVPGPFQPSPGRDNEANENPVLPGYYNSRWVQDPVVQKVFSPFAMPTPIQNWDGVYNYWGPIPPDTNGEVSDYYYMQTVNSGFQIFAKDGTSLYGPANNNALWRGFGGPCETRNDGDPIVIFDQLANRWNLSQFTSAPPYLQCMAVSTSGDPLGTWYRYAFFESNTVFGDYPKVSMWPDAYYMGVNQFEGGSGGGNYAFEREAMLSGDPNAAMVYFQTQSGGALPADLEGFTLPPAGSPGYFLFPTDSGNGVLTERKFDVDWTNPVSSTFTGITLTVAPWNPVICSATRGQCIQQPITTTQLEAIADRFMFRLIYRNMGSHEALVANHTVNISSTTPGIAGVRWYEIRQPMTPTLFQQGTFTLNDNTHRWMGSISMDRVGNIAMGYSASSSVISPSVRYAGRLVTDPPGVMGQGEATMYQGMGVEDFPGTGRWGDYSDITVDPSDDCTFWYTTEYFALRGDRNWRTRVGSFRFPNCTGPAPTPTPCAMNFSDVQPDNPFYEFVRCLYCQGAISGYADGTFLPFNPTTRGQLTKIVVLGFSMPINTSGGQHFSDVPPDYVFYPFIETAFNAGLISGYADGTFLPGNNVTRGQLSKIVVQAASNNQQGWLLISPDEPTFSDVPLTNAFYAFIETAYCHGIISGYEDGTFQPGNNATRGQISKIVCLAVRNLGACDVIPYTPTPTPAPTNCPGGISYSDSITNSSPVQFGRINRNAIASACLTPKVYPGAADARPRHYEVFTYTTAITQCVTIRVTHDCGDNHLLTAAYLDSYNPSILSQNYLGDMGSGGPTMEYSVNIPGGHSLIVVVNEGTANIGCSDFTVNINPCTAVQTATPTTTSSPTPTEDVCTGNTYSITTATATMIPGGTDIDNHCDDCTTGINLPFPFTIYGQAYTSARVGSNGNLQFASDQPNITRPPCVPVGINPPFRYTIHAYYDDLRTDNASENTGIFTQTIGTAPNRQFVVRWHTTYFDGPGTADFEIVLTEGQQNFRIIYGPSEEQGLNAGVGIQRSQAVYTQFSCNTATLTSGLQLNFNTVSLQCTATPTRTSTPIGGSPTPTCVPSGWGGGPDFPSAVVRSVGVYYPGNGRFYSMGGRSSDTAGSDLLNPYEFNPATNTWTQKTATFSNNQVNNVAGAVLTVTGQSLIVVVGGSAGGGTTAIGDVRLYDPVADTLVVLASDPWPPGVLSNTVPGGMAVYNNKMYIMGGFVVTTGSQTMVDTIWEFDPARPTASRWQLKNSRLPVQLGYVPAATIGNFIYTGGGATWDGTTLQDSANAYRYDPTADAITTLPNMPQATGETRAVNWNGNLWVLGGGRTAPNPGNMVQIFNPTSSTWSLGTPFTTARRNFPADVNPGNAIYLVGGYAPTAPNANMEIYRGSGGNCPTSTPGSPVPTNTFTPTTGVGNTNTPTRTTTPQGPTNTPTPTGTPGSCTPGWSLVAPVTAPLLDSGVASQGGFVYTFSGVSAGAIVATSYRYDPSTNTWSTIAALPAAREQPSAVSDGTYIYIMGGADTTGVNTNTMYRYNPANNTYMTMAPFTTASWAQAAAYVSGAVYKIAGCGANCLTFLNAVERYDIAGNTWSTVAPYPEQMGWLMAVGYNGMVYAAGGINTAASTKTYMYNPGTNTWDDAAFADLAIGRWGSASDALGTSWILAGGYAPATVSNTAVSYSFTGNSWTDLPNMTTERARFGGAAVGGNFYTVGGRGLAGGFNGTTETQRYIATCGPTFTPGPSFTPTRTFTFGPSLTPTPTPTGGVCNPTWVPAPSITPARFFFQGAVGTDQKFYIAGGHTSNTTVSNRVEQFNPTTNAWAAVATLPVAVGQVSVGAAGGKVYAAGGFLGGTAVTSTLQIYDIATNAWSFGPSMPGSVEAGAGVVLSDTFYVIGGDDFTNGLSTVYRFNTATNTWSTGAPLPATRTNTSATAYGGYIYVFGGAIGTTFTADDHLLRYDPVANSWTDLGSAGTGGYGNYGTVSPLGNNRLLVTDGGNTMFQAVAATHIYNITTSTWSSGPPLIAARMGQAWAALADGRLITAGGYGPGTPQVALSSVELLPSCGPGLQGVQITGFAFVPPNLNVARGTTVRWTNMDAVAHDATSTASPPVWGSGPLAQNEFYQFTFNTAGTYPYICTIHPAMTGTITVAP